MQNLILSTLLLVLANTSLAWSNQGGFQAGPTIDSVALRQLYSVNAGPKPYHKPFVTGKNSCYMAQAYFPKNILQRILPHSLSVPSNHILQSFYPGTPLQENSIPFMMSFCHGREIQDVWTKKSVPVQEEIMFVFPVIYRQNATHKYLCSYVPVLYLDSLLGVIGGLYFGLRKEYHPNMEVQETSSGKSWIIDNILEANFEKTSLHSVAMPSFFTEIFNRPFVTNSYPTPLSTTVFYEAQVKPILVNEARTNFHWNYKKEKIISDANTEAIFSDYTFTMSTPLNGKKYFRNIPALSQLE